ncbi:uncharacterized protein LOC143912810 [Arctopsyche grandis]|uniref:uncharacterized protein LOC143912810 n=1 Tax=Arctopsyche grandis TaxID=121162 RepID=UPI00406D78CB
MVQEFCILRCFRCETFQVQIVKKSNKWECKMCGIKQSLKQVYGKGTSKDCRHHAQKLNELRIIGEFPIANSIDSEITVDSNNVTVDDANNSSEIGISNPKVPNKWSKYIDEEIAEKANDDDGDVVDGVRYVLNIPQKDRKRKSKSDDNIVKKVCLNPESNNYQNCNTDDNTEQSLNENYIQTNSQTVMCDDESPADFKQSVIQHEKNVSFEEPKCPSTFKEKPIDKNNKWAKYIEESDDSGAETFEDISIRNGYQAGKINSDADVGSPKYPLQQTNTYPQDTSLINNDIPKSSGSKLFDVFNNDDDLNLDEIFNI